MLRLMVWLRVLFIGLVLITHEKPGSRDGASAGKRRLWYPGSCKPYALHISHCSSVGTVPHTFVSIENGYNLLPCDNPIQLSTLQSILDCPRNNPYALGSIRIVKSRLRFFFFRHGLCNLLNGYLQLNACTPRFVCFLFFFYMLY